MFVVQMNWDDFCKHWIKKLPRIWQEVVKVSRSPRIVTLMKLSSLNPGTKPILVSTKFKHIFPMSLGHLHQTLTVNSSRRVPGIIYSDGKNGIAFAGGINAKLFDIIRINDTPNMKKNQFTSTKRLLVSVGVKLNRCVPKRAGLH